MSKRKSDENMQLAMEMEDIREMPASEMLKSNFMPYAMSVIVSRALPEIDGLKPSHRKILYTMYEMGLLTGIRTKSANIAARAMLLNPHGDAGNYETMVRMAQNNETLLTPLVDGKGNFGKHYSRDMAYAASRYTEAKLLPVAGEFFRSINKDTVDFVDNYDSTRKEPVLLPVTFPNILANPTEGIAVGMASSIPSFNLSELCDATIMRIQDQNGDIRAVMPAPDFTTGAEILLEPAVMQKAYETGSGSIKLRAKYQVDTKKHIIEVTEIPYTTNAETIIEGIIALIKAGKITEISDVRNEIDLNGFKIAIDYKQRGVDPDALMQKLFKLTKLQDTYSFNMTVLIDGYPKLLGVNAILDEWLKWRRQCVKRELAFDIAKKSKELHRLEGLAKVLMDIDKAIRIIRNTPDDDQVIPALMKGFGIDEEQAEYIAEIKLRNLNQRYILDKTSAIDRLKGEIAMMQKQLGSEKEINKIIISTLKDVKKKYGQPRKTQLVEYVETAAGSTDVTVRNYNVMIYRSAHNYIKKIPLTSLKNAGEIKTKDDDEVVQEFAAENVNELLFFTNHQNAYKLDVSTLKDSKPSDLGEYSNNLLELEDGEVVLFVCKLDPAAMLLIGFENGKVAKIPMSGFETKQKRKKLMNAYYAEEMPVAFIPIAEETDIAMEDSKGRLLVVNTAMIALKTTKSTQGVQVLRLTKSMKMASMNLLTEYPEITDTKRFRSRAIPAAGAKRQSS